MVAEIFIFFLTTNDPTHHTYNIQLTTNNFDDFFKSLQCSLYLGLAILNFWKYGSLQARELLVWVGAPPPFLTV
jgi:hypothetical protein